jgi:hypothetical protein
VSSEVQIRVSDANSAVRIAADDAGRAHTYLKQTPFLLAMYVLGHDNNPKRAALIRMSARAVANALEPDSPVGGDFIANTVKALKPYAKQLKRVGLDVSMDTFFEAREESEEQS